MENKGGNPEKIKEVYNMKRKIFSVLLALVLVVSFSLVTAVPAPVAAAEGTNYSPFGTVLYIWGADGGDQANVMKWWYLGGDGDVWDGHQVTIVNSQWPEFDGQWYMKNTASERFTLWRDAAFTDQVITEEIGLIGDWDFPAAYAIDGWVEFDPAIDSVGDPRETEGNMSHMWYDHSSCYGEGNLEIKFQSPVEHGFYHGWYLELVECGWTDLNGGWYLKWVAEDGGTYADRYELYADAEFTQLGIPVEPDKFVVYGGDYGYLYGPRGRFVLPYEVWVDDGGSDDNPGTEFLPFATIQKGIDMVAEDGTVNVAEGTYNEHVVIDKQLTLLGANAGVNPVTEERGDESIIDGTELTPAVGGLVLITAAADGIVFDGFTVRESLFSCGGIDIKPGSDNSIYENNIVSDNGNTGFFILGDGNVLRNNVISNNRHSGEIGQINLQMGADDNIIENNAISGGGWIQIMLWNAFDGNIIQNNTITGIGLAEYYENPTGQSDDPIGIVLSDVGIGNIVRGNTIAPEEGGLGFGRAINIAGARFGGLNTLVEDNTIHNNVVGVKVGTEMDTTLVKGNDIQGNEYGIKVEKTAEDTIIEQNDLLSNEVGIIIWASSAPTAASTTHINQNNIVDNTIGVLNEISTPVDATSNWWGTTDGSAIAPMISGEVDYSPWWGESYLTGTAPNIELVDHAWTWYTNDSIQEAIGIASDSDTINVAAGIYTEYLHITTDNLVIEGAGIDVSIIDLDGLIPYWHYPGSGSFASRAGVLITGYGSPDEIIEGVTFSGFTVKNAGLNPPITATGTATLANADIPAVLTDSAASWTENELVGQWVHNVSDKLIKIDIEGNTPIRSYGEITANTATTVTATLAGGLENDWDVGDTYVVIPYEEYVDVAEDLQDDVRGIAIANGKNVLIQYCKVINSGYGGISAGKARLTSLKQSEGVTIDNCISSDHPQVGISVGSYIGSVTIINNTCNNNKRVHPTDPTREYAGVGIQVSGLDANNPISGLIAGNTCSNNGFEGIVLKDYSDGVTVENNTVTGSNLDQDGAGIFFYCSEKGGPGDPDYGNPAGCLNHTIRNNIVTGNIRGICAYYAQECLIEGNTITTASGDFDSGQAAIKIDGGNNITVKDNIISCDGVGIRVTNTWNNVESYANTFTSNTITGAKFAGVRITKGARDNTFEYNTVTGTTSLTIGEDTQGDGVFIDDDAGTGNIFHWNNIYGNAGDGMENQTGTPVDAKYNWWDEIGGPGGVGSGKGDNVATNVDYDPWLTEDYATTIDAGIAYFGSTIPLEPGWNTLSVPLKLKDSANTMAEIAALGDFLISSVTAKNWEIAYQYNPEIGNWQNIGNIKPAIELVPLRGYYIKILGTDTVDFPVLYSGQLGLPALELSAGWNLIGSGFGIDKVVEGGTDSGDYGIAAVGPDIEIPLDAEALKPMLTALDSIKANCSVVVSPTMPGQTAAWAMPITAATEEAPAMIVGEAYWVFMTAPATLAGFEITPIYYLP